MTLVPLGIHLPLHIKVKLKLSLHIPSDRMPPKRVSSRVEMVNPSVLKIVDRAWGRCKKHVAPRNLNIACLYLVAGRYKGLEKVLRQSSLQDQTRAVQSSCRRHSFCGKLYIMASSRRRMTRGSAQVDIVSPFMKRSDRLFLDSPPPPRILSDSLAEDRRKSPADSFDGSPFAFEALVLSMSRSNSVEIRVTMIGS